MDDQGEAAVTTRIGIGYDSHRFDEGRPLVLGGVTIPGEPGLRGHSDGDAIAHAVTDAILGAAGEDDIGAHFPDTDPAHKGADSMLLLAGAVEVLSGEGWQIGNVDVTVVTEAPKIRPWAARMRARLSDILGIPVNAVSIKGKSNEGLGWIGRREGIAVMAVATVHR